MTPAPEQDPPITSPLELIMTPGNWWLCSSTSHAANGEGQVGDRDRYNYFIITRENNGPIIFSLLLVMVMSGVQFGRKSYEWEQNQTTEKQKSDLSITSVNGNTITTFIKTKMKNEKNNFLNVEYFLTLLQVHNVTLVYFCLCFQPFFYSFHERRTQMSCII